MPETTERAARAERERARRAESARRDLYYQSRVVRASGEDFLDRESLLREGGSLEDLLFHATPDDIARLEDSTAILLVSWAPDVNGWWLQPSIAWEVLEPPPWQERTSSVGASDNPGSEKGKRGRPPKSWWPEFGIGLAMRVYLRGIPEKNSEMENDVLQWLTDDGYPDAGRETIRPAIARFMELSREEDRKGHG